MTLLHYFFDLTSFLRLGQKYKNIFVWFFVQMKTLKFAFKIYWPLVGRPSRVTNYYYHFAGPLCVSNWFCRRGAIRYIILANPSWHCFSQGQRQGTMKKSPMIMVSLILIYVLFFVGESSDAHCYQVTIQLTLITLWEEIYQKHYTYWYLTYFH